MPVPAPGQRALRTSLLAGAGYDLALGAVVLAQGDRIADALGHPLGAARPYFLIAALPLFILPVLYAGAATARDPGPFRVPVLWARGGGGLGLLVLTALGKPSLAWLFVVLGVLDLAWAALHLSLWRRG